ncbi:MAG: hypothetical protein NZ529_05420 [Cytophagaceae bacterium]|nr:hypothetical protein [Cytophagaceae bacterium]MDW8456215.1 hypothetical protein [Cytophagaceae bacterium]
MKDTSTTANASVGSVNKVFHKEGDSEQSQPSANDVTEQMNYTPHILTNALTQKKDLKIAVLYSERDYPHKQYSKYKEGIERAARHINQFGIEICIHTYHPDQQLDKWMEVLSYKPDAIAYAACGHLKEGSVVLEKLIQLQTPLYYIGVEQDALASYSVARYYPDYFSGGYIAAKLLHYGLINDATILIINDKTHNENTQALHENNTVNGFKNFFKENNLTQIRLVQVHIDNQDERELRRVLTETFMHYTFIRGIFVAANCVHAVGAFLREKKLSSVRAIGIVQHEEDRTCLKEGLFDFLLDFNLEKIGYQCLINILEHCLFKTAIDCSDVIKVNILTRENC